MHKVENEIISASGFEPRKKYADRQDYLKSLLLAVTKMDEEDFDGLSDDAAAWANHCVAIYNAGDKEEYPDFDEDEVYNTSDAEDEDEPEEEAEEETEEPEAEEPETDDDSEEEDEPEEDEPEEAEEEPETEEEPEPEPEVKKPPKKPAKVKVKEPTAAQKKRVAQGAKDKVPPPKKKPAPRDGDAELDKWGCIVGSKNSEALAMFEKGATSREVKLELGGTFYNLLGKMVKNGHTMEKEGAFIKIIHKDAKKAPVKAPAKKPKK